MPVNYADMRLIYANMPVNYVDMRLIYVDMRLFLCKHASYLC